MAEEGMVILIYILFCLLALLAMAPPRGELPRRVVYAVCGVVLFLVAALRPASSVPDYIVYEAMYAFIADSGTYNYFLEPSFNMIALFVDRWLGNPLFLFVIYAALGVWLKMTAVKRLSELWFLSLIIYFATFFLQQEMVQIRAGVAIGFVLMAIKPLYERKLGPFLLLVACAVLFHFSALAALPIWFLPRHRRYNWFLWGIIPAGILIYLAQVNLLNFVFPFPVIQAKLQGIFDQQAAGMLDSVSVFGPAHVIRMALYYLLLSFHSKLLQHNRYATLLLYIYAVGLFVGWAFGAFPVVAGRLSDIFLVVEMVLAPMLVHVISPREVGRGVVVGVAFCHLLLAVAVGERLVV